MLCHYLTQCRNQFQFFVDALSMFRRRYYFNFKKKIFLFLLHPYFTTMAFGPKFDILVSTVSSRSITEQLTARTIFNLYSRILRRGFYRFLRFLIENSLPCITIPPNMVAFIHTLFLVILLPCISKSFSIKLVVFPSLHCMCLFCWPFKNMLTTFLQHRAPVILNSGNTAQATIFIQQDDLL